MSLEPHLIEHTFSRKIEHGGFLCKGKLVCKGELWVTAILLDVLIFSLHKMLLGGGSFSHVTLFFLKEFSCKFAYVREN